MNKDYVTLRAIASHLGMTRERLIENGANIKENKLIWGFKNEQKEIQISKYEFWIKLSLKIYSLLQHSVILINAFPLSFEFGF